MMSLITDNERGPDYVQIEKPNILTEGSLWLRSDKDKVMMSDGTDFWAEPELGVAGYIASGVTSNWTTTIEKTLFTTETTATLTSGTTQAKSAYGCNSLIAGYSMTGWVGGVGATTRVEKLLFSNDSTASIVSSVRASGEASGYNSTVCGYSAGNYYIDRITFATEVTAALGNLSATRGAPTSVANSDKAIIMGGYYGNLIDQNTAEKMTFPSEAVSNVTSTMASGVRGGGPCYSTTRGYSLGGAVGAGYTNVIDRVEFSTELFTRLSSTTSTSTYLEDTSFSSKLSGYGAGGTSGTTAINRIKFADEVVAILAAGLPTARTQGSAFENLN